jgi:Uma2 family endonuclease
MVAKLPPFRFTVDQYHRMIDTGVLTEDDRVELIRGEIVPKMPIGDRHVRCVNRLNRLVTRLTADDIVVSVQNPVVLTDSEPEPDVVLYRESSTNPGVKPRPSQVLLLVEVADATFERDCDEKLPLYAENGLSECWIVNLNDDTVHVFRGPKPDGAWGATQQLTRGGTLTIAALPGISLAVNDILP